MASTDELLAALAAALKSKQDAPAPRAAAAPKKTARVSHIDDIEIHEEPSHAKRAAPTDDDFEIPKRRPGRPPKAATAAAPAPAPKERKMPVRAAPHSCNCPHCGLKQ